MLCRLVAAKKEGVDYSVISLKGEGFYGKTLVANGLTPYYFRFDRFFQLASFFEFFRMVSVISTLSPDVVQTWLYHANLMGGVAARLAGCKRVVWGIRSASLSPSLASLFTRAVSWLSAKLSSVVPAAIATCSIEAANEHKKMGYDPSKFCVIPNGFDLARYKPDPLARQQLRQQWGVTEHEILFGCVARWDVYKDHPNLLQALSIAAARGLKFRCVLVGGGLTVSNTVLTGLLSKYNLENFVLLAGSRADIPAVMNAIDFHLLPSRSEAFPNVVAEAMACGTPCVVTDVGDAALIVGETGWVVPPENSDLLAQALEEAGKSLKTNADESRRIEVRNRVVNNFSLEKMTQSYITLWQSVLLS